MLIFLKWWWLYFIKINILNSISGVIFGFCLGSEVILMIVIVVLVVLSEIMYKCIFLLKMMSILWFL